VEHTPHGVFGFEGRDREVKAHERFLRSLEWGGMPGHVAAFAALDALMKMNLVRNAAS